MISECDQIERYESCTKRNDNDYRTPWERDFARIIHSAAFRRLQSKTQIFGLGDSDFYRTRLTHSLEVSQISAAIVNNIKRRPDQELKSVQDILPDTTLISAIGLAHDLGHPPFGHGGEAALNYCMNEFGGFEGNGQTLRILSRLEKFSENSGLNPTRRLLLGILKYPVSYSKLFSEDIKLNICKNIDSPMWKITKELSKPPKCYLDSEKDVVEWMLKPFSNADRDIFTTYSEGAFDEEGKIQKHSKTQYKTLDASIMELADDISYGVHDLEDAIALGLITEKKFFKVVKDEYGEHCVQQLVEKCDADPNFWEKLFSKNAKKRKFEIGFLVNLFIVNATVIDLNAKYGLKFSDELLRYNVCLEGGYKKLNEILRFAVSKCVIKHTNVQLLEFKGQKIVTDIFDVLESDPQRFLPGSTKKIYGNASGDLSKKRIICDYIAGMTDEYATKFYDKLFNTRKGSVFDRL